MFRRFIPFFLENLFMEICPLRLCTWDFSLWRCVYGDLSIADWRKGDLFLFEDLFMEICPLKICSGDFSFWRCIHEDLSIGNWSVGDLSLFEDLSFGNLNKRFIPWKFVHGDLSFENLNRRYIPWRFVLCRFVQEIFHFSFCFGDLSF